MSGWTAIVGERTRPEGRASVFKVPHHGSVTADAPEVWRQMLEPEPLAVLAPWRRGDKALPTPEDVARILSRTMTAFASADPKRSANRPDELLVRTPLGTSVRSDGVNVDIDARGNLVGFDIDRASNQLDLSSLETTALPLRSYRIG